MEDFPARGLGLINDQPTKAFIFEDYQAKGPGIVHYQVVPAGQRWKPLRNLNYLQQ